MKNLTKLALVAAIFVVGAVSAHAQLTGTSLRLTVAGGFRSTFVSSASSVDTISWSSPSGVGVLLGSTYSGGTLGVTYGQINLAADTYITGILDVPNGGTGAGTFTQNGIIIGNGTNPLTSSAELANGQLLIGSTGNAPVASTLTQGTGITITNGAGTITIASAVNPQDLGVSTSVATTLVDQDYILTAPFDIVAGAYVFITLVDPNNDGMVATVTSVDDATDQVTVHLSGFPGVAGSINAFFQNP